MSITILKEKETRFNSNFFAKIFIGFGVVSLLCVVFIDGVFFARIINPTDEAALGFTTILKDLLLFIFTWTIGIAILTIGNEVFEGFLQEILILIFIIGIILTSFGIFLKLSKNKSTIALVLSLIVSLALLPMGIGISFYLMCKLVFGNRPTWKLNRKYYLAFSLLLIIVSSFIFVLNPPTVDSMVSNQLFKTDFSLSSDESVTMLDLFGQEDIGRLAEYLIVIELHSGSIKLNLQQIWFEIQSTNEYVIDDANNHYIRFSGTRFTIFNNAVNSSGTLTIKFVGYFTGSTFFVIALLIMFSSPFIAIIASIFILNRISKFIKSRNIKKREIEFS